MAAPAQVRGNARKYSTPLFLTHTPTATVFLSPNRKVSGEEWRKEAASMCNADRHHPDRKRLFDQNLAQYVGIEAKHDGEHNPRDRWCIVLGQEPVDTARCPICREAATVLLDPDYAPLGQVRAALELGGV